MGWRERAQNLLWRGFLPGILLGDWLKLLKANRYEVDWPFRRRAVAVTIGAAVNSVIHCHEAFRYNRRIRKTTYSPPVFVLGVMRSGTTHLFNLMSEDKRFAFPNYIQVMNPNTFLSAEWFFAWAMDAVAPKTRFLDNMEYGSKIPEEDEYAILGLTQLSFMLTGPFPRSGQLYNRYLTFRDASAEDRERWKNALRFFVQKLTFKNGPRPLVLKSPAHTGRIRMILEVFPDAKFVYIHRNPYEVFQSYVQMVMKFAGMITLQRFGGSEDLTDHTIRVYKELSEAFLDERDLIPKGNYCEVSYEDLTADAMGQMRRIYETLSLPDFKAVEPDLQKYVASISDYKKNKKSELPIELQVRIATEWHRYFKAFAYPTPVQAQAREPQ